MTILMLLLAVALLGLVRYARHDRFAGPSSRGRCLDELGVPCAGHPGI